MIFFKNINRTFQGKETDKIFYFENTYEPLNPEQKSMKITL
jgi:hypothetical protein